MPTSLSSQNDLQKHQSDHASNLLEAPYTRNKTEALPVVYNHLNGLLIPESQVSIQRRLFTSRCCRVGRTVTDLSSLDSQPLSPLSPMLVTLHARTWLYFLHNVILHVISFRPQKQGGTFFLLFPTLSGTVHLMPTALLGME